MCYWYETLGYGIYDGYMINKAEMLLLKHNGILIINR